MSSSRPLIGIVGGMGPLAGVDLFRKIIRNVDASRDQDHPAVVLMSYPHRFPDRTAYLTGKSSESPAPAIANVLRSLDRMGAQVSGMPCNTAHAPQILDVVHRELRRHNCKTQFVNMIEETVRYVLALPGGPRSIGLLTTIGTRQTRLYHSAMEAAGLRVVELPADEHDALAHRAVYDPEVGIKARSEPTTAEARAWILQGVDRLVDAGADAVVLGCTELPLAVPDSSYGGVPLVDPAHALARALIRKTYPDRLRSEFGTG
jgi:aspartate racemase